MDYVLLGKRLREERQKLNLTQERLAEKIDVSSGFIGQLERAERVLSLDTLVKLASELGVTVDYLLHDSLITDNEQFLNQIKQIMMNRSSKEMQMALDVLKLMFSHMDDITSSSEAP